MHSTEEAEPVAARGSAGVAGVTGAVVVGRSGRSSTRDFVSDYIRERIFTGDYPPYSRIPQDEVAAAVGMSRIPVREALVSLEAEGYVSMPTNRGAFVV